MPNPSERARVRAQLHDLLMRFRSGEILAQAERGMAHARPARLRPHWLVRYEAEREAQDAMLASLAWSA